MQSQLAFRNRRPTVGALLLVGVGLALISCSNDPGARVGNIAPHVRLTGGPVQGDSVEYTAEFFWTGWDEDGIIDHYQYSIDIPDSLLGTLNSPTERRIAWTDTTAFRGRFLFTTPVQDTILKKDGTISLPDRYRGNHHFYVRSVDNEGAVSPVDKIGFTARTVTPVTTITMPKVAEGSLVLKVGQQMNVAWVGNDPDNPDPRQRPASYEWKLVAGIGNPASVVVQHAVTVNPGPNFPWNRVSADTTILRLNLNPPEEYVLAIRAIDEAGGVESKFYLGQNALVLASSYANPGTPDLTITERALGTYNVNLDGPVVEFEVPSGRCMTFHFAQDCQAYGGVFQGYNYGIDVPDIDQEGPTSGFRGWSFIPYTYDPICFSTAGNHVLTVKARDTGGGVTVATIILRVIAFPMDRELLYMDDFRLSRSSSGVSDELMDGRVHDMLQAVGFHEMDPQEIFQYDVFEAGDLTIVPATAKLAILARYRMILWSNWGSGYRGLTGLVSSNACPTGRVLQAYMEAGGSAWIYGQQLMGSFKRETRTNECAASLAYDDVTGLNFAAGDFVADYLHITGGDFRNAQITKTNGLVQARPTAMARGEAFPTVVTDSTIFNAVSRGGLPFVDAMFTPAYAAGLDTLYTMETPKSSPFRGKPIAFRYFDPNPAARQGALAVFGFPFHLLKPGEVHEVQTDQGPRLEGTGVHGMAASMFRWFRQHQRTVKAG